MKASSGRYPLYLKTMENKKTKKEDPKVGVSWMIRLSTVTAVEKRAKKLGKSKQTTADELINLGLDFEN